jgi:tripartite ATP-independent transporter DctM subunit
MFKLLGSLLGLLAIAGMPLFAVLGAVSVLSWLSSDDPSHRFLRHVAANVLEEKFAGSIIVVTIPLFVFVGYLMAESKTPQRIVRAASATLGWMPGGLAIVCIMATAVFTMLTGGSGVTIVAIGGLLFPVLLQRGYSREFALGLVTTSGAVGLLLPPSPLVLIYCYVTGVDVGKAYHATLWPGLFLVAILAIYAISVSVAKKVPTQRFDLRECGEALWAMKWVGLAPVLVLGGLGTGLMELHESAAACALYTLIIEVYVHKDLTWKRVLHVAKEATSLSGAIIVILAMAAALTNYIIQAGIPLAVLDWFTERGMSHPWQFLVVMNVFLFIMGALMDAFSVLLVGLPLLVPLAAKFDLHPFYLAAMFLLHLEIAYVTPPIGLNLFIASFRFRVPVVRMYRIVLPFFFLLVFGFIVICFIPSLSTFTVSGEVKRLREEAAQQNRAPTEAWALDCIQQDRNNPIPCTPEDREKWGVDGTKLPDVGIPGVPAADAGTDDDEELNFDDEPTPPKDAGAPGAGAADAGGKAEGKTDERDAVPDAGAGAEDYGF